VLVNLFHFIHRWESAEELSPSSPAFGWLSSPMSGVSDVSDVDVDVDVEELGLPL
jgi:hypothetical protein